MAEYLIQGETLKDIADAIRAKTGGTDVIPVKDMATQISGITGGGGTIDGAFSVTFMSEDGTTKLGERAVLSGNTCGDPISLNDFKTPTKDSTAQHTYTFSGWSLTNGGSVSSSALSKVTEDRILYAVFKESVRLYTVRFYDGTTLLHTVYAEYGSTVEYTPPEKEGYFFGGWGSSNVNITGDTDCYAQWEEKLTFANGTWAQINEVCEAGQAADYFAVGDEKTIYTEAYGNLVLRIIGINFDNKADGSGKAGLTVAATKPNRVAIQEGVWENDNNKFMWWHSAPGIQSDITIKNWCKVDFLSSLPSEMVSVIKPILKTSVYGSSSGWSVSGSLSTGVSHSAKDERTLVFIPSLFELKTIDNSYASYELGVYPGFTTISDRKLYGSNGSSIYWWTRTGFRGNGVEGAYVIQSSGSTIGNYTQQCTEYLGYYPCFCI